MISIRRNDEREMDEEFRILQEEILETIQLYINNKR